MQIQYVNQQTKQSIGFYKNYIDKDLKRLDNRIFQFISNMLSTEYQNKKVHLAAKPFKTQINNVLQEVYECKQHLKQNQQQFQLDLEIQNLKNDIKKYMQIQGFYQKKLAEMQKQYLQKIELVQQNQKKYEYLKTKYLKKKKNILKNTISQKLKQKKIKSIYSFHYNENNNCSESITSIARNNTTLDKMKQQRKLRIISLKIIPQMAKLNLLKKEQQNLFNVIKQKQRNLMSSKILFNQIFKLESKKIEKRINHLEHNIIKQQKIFLKLNKSIDIGNNISQIIGVFRRLDEIFRIRNNSDNDLIPDHLQRIQEKLLEQKKIQYKSYGLECKKKRKVK